MFYAIFLIAFHNFEVSRWNGWKPVHIQEFSYIEQPLAPTKSSENVVKLILICSVNAGAIYSSI